MRWKYVVPLSLPPCASIFTTFYHRRRGGFGEEEGRIGGGDRAERRRASWRLVGVRPDSFRRLDSVPSHSAVQEFRADLRRTTTPARVRRRRHPYPDSIRPNQLQLRHAFVICQRRRYELFWLHVAKSKISPKWTLKPAVKAKTMSER